MCGYKICNFKDAESIASKNNLTFTELLQPFSKMGTDVTMKERYEQKCHVIKACDWSDVTNPALSLVDKVAHLWSRM